MKLRRYSNAEVQAVIDAMGKGYTKEQKGVLWQMATGSTSTKNNPYRKKLDRNGWMKRQKLKKRNKEIRTGFPVRYFVANFIAKKYPKKHFKSNNKTYVQ